MQNSLKYLWEANSVWQTYWGGMLSNILRTWAPETAPVVFLVAEPSCLLMWEVAFYDSSKSIRVENVDF